MFIDLRSVESGHTFDADLCIVGAGAAGIAIADALRSSSLTICMVESGGLDADANAQALADGVMISHPHHELRTSRDRQFGGSTNSWGGACAPMSEGDFRPRPFLDLDGWPYERSALDPFFHRAQKLFEIGPFDYGAGRWTGERFQPLGLDPGSLETRIWQLSPRTNFGRVYRDALEHSSTTTVILHATATQILSNESAAQVDGVEIRSQNGRQATVRARAVVLACGGIDNARLLLLSRRHRPNGLGNDRDLVGRFFMQHPHIGAASIRFTGPKAWVRNYKDFKSETLWLRARIGLTDEAQSRHRVLNPVASLINRFIADSLTHTQSIGYVSLKRVLLDLRHGRVPMNFTNEVVDILKDIPGIATGFMRHLRDQTGAIYVMSEQYPNPDSRVLLSEDKDGFGLEKANVDWRLLPIDKRSILVLMETLQSEFRRLGIAEVEPDEWLIADDHSWPQSLAGGHHHMGTTRMGHDPATSVVDADGRVHGIENLFVAGSSIFPTVGSANPTLTLTATSLKLADHLPKALARLTAPAAVA